MTGESKPESTAGTESGVACENVVEFIRQIFGPKYDAEIAAILQARWLASAAGNKKEGV